MSKYLLCLSFVLISFFADAQVSIWKDTVSIYGVPKTNTDILLYDTIINNTVNPITITWNKSGQNLLTGWTGSGICDEEVGNATNGTCYSFNDVTPHTITIPANGKATFHTMVKASPTADDGVNWVSVNTNYGNMVFMYINWATLAQDFENNNVVSVYPNPIKDFINIHALNPKVSGVNLLNITGTIIAQFDIKATSVQIPLADIAQGIYLLQITDNTGRQIAVKRICKQ